MFSRPSSDKIHYTERKRGCLHHLNHNLRDDLQHFSFTGGQPTGTPLSAARRPISSRVVVSGWVVATTCGDIFASHFILRCLEESRLDSFVLFAPSEPVEGYLGAHDGEEQGEDAVFEVVSPGSVDQDGGRHGQGGDHEQERTDQHRSPRRALDPSFWGRFPAGSNRVLRHSAFGYFLVAFWSEPPLVAPDELSVFLSEEFSVFFSVDVDLDSLSEPPFLEDSVLAAFLP